ncbi:uncharacterized protein LOC112434791 [Maylandia zebra]|uniref:uncharacterized protein LOC112434791 n=1 Tax=Maylandia zebra TaxID=106582 RepID=UPI00403C574D
MVTWTGLLFILCGTLTSALCCDWLTHYKAPMEEARGFLTRMVSTNSPANSRLRSYYRTLANSTLSCSGCSTASWQLLRKETKLRLEQLELLVASIRVPAAASRRRSAATQQQRNTDTISEDCL